MNVEQFVENTQRNRNGKVDLHTISYTDRTELAIQVRKLPLFLMVSVSESNAAQVWIEQRTHSNGQQQTFGSEFSEVDELERYLRLQVDAFLAELSQGDDVRRRMHVPVYGKIPTVGSIELIHLALSVRSSVYRYESAYFAYDGVVREEPLLLNLNTAEPDTSTFMPHSDRAVYEEFAEAEILPHILRLLNMRMPNLFPYYWAPSVP